MSDTKRIKKRVLLHYFSDPGHGWLRVPRAMLTRLGIEEKITPFSYQRGQWVYLEEDCDMSRFCKVCEASDLYSISIRERRPSQRESAIRTYAHYSTEKEHEHAD